MQGKATSLRVTALETLASPVKFVKGLLHIHTLTKETKKVLSSLGIKPVYKKLDYEVVVLASRGNHSHIYVVEKRQATAQDIAPSNAERNLLAAKVSFLDTSEFAVYERKRGYRTDAADIATVAQELRLLKRVQKAEHVVKLEDVLFHVKNGDERLWMVMEYLPLSLSHLEGLGRKVTLEEAAVIASGLIKALEHVHSKGVIHMDLKLENVLLSPSGYVKLCDFGSSVEFVKGEVQYVKSARGTPYAMAFELWEDGERYDERVDVWSLGVVLYVLTRSKPSRSLFADMSEPRRNSLLKVYQESNKRYFISLFDIPGYDWENHPGEFEELRESSSRKEEVLDSYYAHYVEYRELFEFCRRAVVPLPIGGCKNYPVTRGDALDRASLDELKELRFVQDIFTNESMQRGVVQSLVQEAEVKLKKRSDSTT